MDALAPNASTLQELLAELKTGYTLHRAVLINVAPGSRRQREQTLDRTTTMRRPLNWTEEYRREYGQYGFLMLGPNTLTTGPEQAVTVGRSRRCTVRVDNDSVSAVHATMTFDRNTGDYFLVDEGSRNGTCINGVVLTAGHPTPIWAGAYVSFGDAVFVFIDPATLRKLSKLAAL